MKYMEKNQKKKSAIIVIILIVLIAAAVAVAVWLLPGNAPQGNDSATQPTAGTEAGDAAEETTEATEETVPEDVAIETNYCTLYFPGAWAEGLRTEITGESFETSAAFYGCAGGQEVLLFTVCFGGGDGIPMGVYQTSEGYMVDVTVLLSDFAPDETMSEEEADTLCAMQEAVNYVFEKLAENPAYTPN